jgi:endoglucanase
MEELLKRLTETPGPAGQEQHVRDAIAKEILSFCQELREDPLGNLLARIGTNADYRVGILAHMDEVGLIVSQISDRGLISFEVGGTVDARQLPGLEVDLMASDGKLIRGVIGNQSRHLQTAEELGSQIRSGAAWSLPQNSTRYPIARSWGKPWMTGSPARFWSKPSRPCTPP